MKKIIYTITTHGLDLKDRITYASFSEEERDEKFTSEKDFGLRSRNEQIVDIDRARLNAFAKIDALDKLVLGF